MIDITWGREIAVDGKRPAWLGDDTRLEWMVTHIGWKEPGRWREWTRGEWTAVNIIRLPADHFAYRALDAGFEPWGGGDAAPEDWDGRKAMMRNGRMSGVSWWEHEGKITDIIGYKRRTTATTEDTVSVRRMTKDEAYAWLENGPDGVTLTPFGALSRLGLIKPDPTPLDRFMSAHPDADRDTAAKALAWEGR